MTLLIVIAIVAISAIFNGLAVAVTWGWFVVPVFGLPNLTIPSSIGLCLVASLLTHQMRGHRDNQTQHERFVDLLNSAVLHPAMTLIVGWIVKGFLP